MSRYYTFKERFGQGLAIIYFYTFAWLFYQVDDLWGPQGVIRINELFQSVKQSRTVWKLVQMPSLLWFSTDISYIRILLLIGGIAGFLAFWKSLRTTSLLICLVIFMSFMTTSDSFIVHLWDRLLLESTLLLWLISMLDDDRGNDLRNLFKTLAFWGLRLLCIRYYLGCGAEKFIGFPDPRWEDLTFLKLFWHHQTFPTMFSFFLFQLPMALQKSLAYVVFLLEIIAPFALLAPWKIRRYAIWSLAIYNVAIMVAGNFSTLNVFNLLLLCAFIPDYCWRIGMVKVPPRPKPPTAAQTPPTAEYSMMPDEAQENFSHGFGWKDFVDKREKKKKDKKTKQSTKKKKKKEIDIVIYLWDPLGIALGLAVTLQVFVQLIYLANTLSPQGSNFSNAWIFQDSQRYAKAGPPFPDPVLSAARGMSRLFLANTYGIFGSGPLASYHIDVYRTPTNDPEQPHLQDHLVFHQLPSPDRKLPWFNPILRYRSEAHVWLFAFGFEYEKLLLNHDFYDSLRPWYQYIFNPAEASISNHYYRPPYTPNSSSVVMVQKACRFLGFQEYFASGKLYRCEPSDCVEYGPKGFQSCSPTQFQQLMALKK